jgi:predicted transposase/invertase (TIGR01784 family)
MIDPVMKVDEKIVAFMNDKEAFRAYQMKKQAMSDWTSAINHARREGILEGKLEVKWEVASKMKKCGVSPAQIAEATGLSIEEIEKL